MSTSQLANTFAGKTVLVTGHTGFKGSWLTIWLVMLGARVVGVSNGVPTEPSNFSACQLGNLAEDRRIDLADTQAIRELVSEAKPDYVFHLAAQALVLDAYADPLTTFTSNVLGTASVLDALRHYDRPCSAVIITSDKCYDNVEWVWGYRETDRLGGKDPYSASKGAAELVIRSYFESWLKTSNIRIGVARAGNVIGGGDWAANRLIPDCVRAWSSGESVAIKNPAATRPWQLVLEPLSGYLALARMLDDRSEINGEAYNFGPSADSNFSVGQLIEEMRLHWGNIEWKSPSDRQSTVYEAGLLKLNCDKALAELNWRPTYSFSETVEATASWYRSFYDDPSQSLSRCRNQIEAYSDQAHELGVAWAE